MDSLAKAAAIALILSATLPYLIGSIPFAYILAKWKGYGDLREKGSRNVGATNILRISGDKKLATQVLILDVLKGFVVGALFGAVAPTMGYIAGFMALIGHVFPIWLKFRGGKGVTVFFGTVLGINPLVGIIGAISWFLIGRATRKSALASLGGAFVCVIAAAMLTAPGPLFPTLPYTGTTLFGLLTQMSLYEGQLPFAAIPLASYILPTAGVAKYCMFGLVFLCLTHISNIKRLLNGQEDTIDVVDDKAI